MSSASFVLFAAVLVPAEAQPAAPVPPVEEHGPLESWTCTVNERLDRNVGGMLQMLVDPDGTRRELSFYLSWSEKPGYMAMQQMRWVWIPLDATRLWKPDDFTISIANGYYGYLPTPDQHALGGYETWRARSSYLEVNASEKILAAALRQLEKVSK